MLGLKAQVIVLQVPKSLEQQRRAGQQDKRQSDFASHQNTAKHTIAARQADAASVLQNALHIDTPGA